MNRFSPAGFYPYLWSVCSAFAAALALSFEWAYPLAFLCMVPLFGTLSRAGGLLRGAGIGFTWGFVFAAAVGYGVFFALHDHYGKSAFFSLLFMTGFVLVPAGILYGIVGAACRFLYRDTMAFFALVAPSVLVLCEYLREILPGMIPWGGLGYSLTASPLLLQTADTWGQYGLSWILFCINGLVWAAISGMVRSRRLTGGEDAYRTPQSSIKALLPAGIAVLALALLCTYGGIALNRWRSPERAGGGGAPGIQAVIAQASHGQRERWRDDSFYARLESYLALSGAPAGEGRMIVWPETVLNSPRRLQPALFARLAQAAGENGVLLSGGVRHAAGGEFNAVWTISGDGETSSYDKHILLPFAETAPLESGGLGAYYEAPSRFEPGTGPLTVSTVHGKVGTSICFELLYGDFIRQSVRGGAGILVNVSNDAWFGDSNMPRIHARAAAMRAVEERRYVLRASNSGISAVVAPSGDVFAQTALFSREALRAEIHALDTDTVFARAGYWVVYASILIVMGALVRMLARGGATGTPS
ncbi:MAG: apolipoprotein N-acyltransferase [Spirochaetes bacterium]|nr:MAG: apolipoprotein N-acyltransferase [Spirochaetota bacterium]